MLSPLIPDIRHPKWIIAQNVLEFVDSKRAVKVASRLRIKDIDNFIIVMKILLISSLFERDVSNVISEINAFEELYMFSWPGLISVSVEYRVPVASMSPGRS